MLARDPTPVSAVLLLAVFMFGAFGVGADARDEVTDDECPPYATCDGEVPLLTTGHSVYFNRTVVYGPVTPRLGLLSHVAIPSATLPTLPGSDRGHHPDAFLEGQVAQKECVGWSSGVPVDHRPITAARNWHPSDGDESVPGRAHQDYDLDELDVTCVLSPQESSPRPYIGLPTDFGVVAGIYVERYDGFPIPRPPIVYGDYAVAVESGDCSPYEGHAHRWRATLDFVDPNGVYHEVQEYDYVCGNGARGGPAGNLILDPTGRLFNESDAWARGQFPWNGVGIDHWVACDPADRVESGHGYHRCNGNMQDLVRERLWITRTHSPVYDFSWDESYSFALQVDTCSGISVFERARTATPHARPLEEALGPVLCSDGSSYSFDDTDRIVVDHTHPPEREEAIRSGNAYDFSASSPSFGKHRSICRNEGTDWVLNRPREIRDECYAEDHRGSAVDVYLSEEDPTGLFETHRVDTEGAPGYLGVGPVEGPRTDRDPAPEPIVPPDAVPPLVTGHTAFARMYVNKSGSPPVPPVTAPESFDDSSPGPHYRLHPDDPPARVLQAECVVWHNGKNLDQRGAGDDDGWGSENAHPSDEQEHGPFGVLAQDYDMDRLVDTCAPAIERAENETLMVGLPTDFAAMNGFIEDVAAAATGSAPPLTGFMTLVEQGDCDPSTGQDFRYRGHLDFVDPNNIYHEIQEYDFVCAPGSTLADEVKASFPHTWTDPQNRNGCRMYGTPADTADPLAGTPGHFDFGHKCNGSVQDLVTERMWITPLHDPVYDPTVEAVYNFALMADTCAGVSVFEGVPILDRDGGLPAEGEKDDYGQAFRPSSSTATLMTLEETLAMAGLRHRATETCTSGSSFSFDDTGRVAIEHSSQPATRGMVAAGNSYDADAGSGTFGKHRQNCRQVLLDWHKGAYAGTSGMTEACYQEPHRTAWVDLSYHPSDPTGLWDHNDVGLTGLNAYVEGESTGPDYRPPSR